MGEGKRGMSDVISVVLLILLVIVAIAIIWGFIRIFLVTSVTDSDFTLLSTDFEVVKDSAKIVEDPSDPTIKSGQFLLKRKTGEGNVVGFYISYEDKDGKNVAFSEKKTVGKLGTLLISKDVPADFGEWAYITIAPIYLLESGREATGKIVLKYKIPIYTPGLGSNPPAGNNNPPAGNNNPPICTSNWQCSSWSTCTAGIETRTCTDANNCGTISGKPIESQSCGATCTESWTCSSWSTCDNNQETRTCTDANACGTTTNKPVEIQSCTAAPTCTLSNPRWSVLSAQEGTQVGLLVDGSGPECNSLKVQFEVREDDVFTSQAVTTNPSEGSFVGNQLQGSWIAEYQSDISGDPEYFFIATLVSDSSSVTSSRTKAQELTVMQAPPACTDADSDGYGASGTTLTQCSASTTLSDCNDNSASIKPGTTELCNSVDDDCDGQTDEGYNVGTSCTVGVGACQRTGKNICSSTTTTQCSATAGSPGTEICGNGIDEDCNGSDLSCPTSTSTKYYAKDGGKGWREGGTGWTQWTWAEVDAILYSSSELAEASDKDFGYVFLRHFGEVGQNLRTGHRFRIKVNENPANVQILRINAYHFVGGFAQTNIFQGLYVGNVANGQWIELATSSVTQSFQTGALTSSSVNMNDYFETVGSDRYVYILLAGKSTVGQGDEDGPGPLKHDVDYIEVEVTN